MPIGRLRIGDGGECTCVHPRFDTGGIVHTDGVCHINQIDRGIHRIQHALCEKTLQFSPSNFSGFEI